MACFGDMHKKFAIVTIIYILRLKSLSALHAFGIPELMCIQGFLSEIFCICICPVFFCHGASLGFNHAFRLNRIRAHGPKKRKKDAEAIWP